MKKTTIVFFLTIIGVIVSVAANGDSFYGIINYTVISEKEKTCQTKEGNAYNAGTNYSGSLTVPEKVYNGSVEYTVIAIGSNSFLKCNQLTSATIPNTVLTIGSSAFYDCYGMKSIKIGESVMSIGEGAFKDCIVLNRAEFSSIEALCNISFSDPYANPLYYAHHLYVDGEELKTVDIPENVTTLKSYAFYGCSSLTSLTIPETISAIGSKVFYDCTSLTDVEYKSADPVAANEDIFPSKIYKTATLHIPAGTMDVYLETTPWNLFLNIEEDNQLSAVGEISNDTLVKEIIDYEKPYDVYNLQGMRIGSSKDDLKDGIYIVRQGNKISKIFIR